jgi:hypothetical protein
LAAILAQSYLERGQSLVMSRAQPTVCLSITSFTIMWLKL